MISPETAREILRRTHSVGRDYHALPSSVVCELLEYADEMKYRKPKNANGSRGRYFHAYLVRRADAA
jgi:hypothetical protein